MKPEAQRIAIAKACHKIQRWRFALCPNNQPVISMDGYVSKEEAEKEWKRLNKYGESVSKVQKYRVKPRDLPDFLNDLNAMHEAEKVLIPIAKTGRVISADYPHLIYYGNLFKVLNIKHGEM